MERVVNIKREARYQFAKTLLRIGLATTEKLIVINGKYKYIIV